MKPAGHGAEGPAALQVEIERRLRAGEHAEALPLLRRLLAVVPESPEFRHVTAMTALRQGQFREAAELMDGLPEGGPRPGERSFALGLCRWALDETATARAAFERALRMAPTHVPSLRFASELLARAGEVEALRALYDQAAGRGVDPALLCPPEAAGRTAPARRIAESYRRGLAAQLVAQWCDPEPKRPVRASVVLVAGREPRSLLRLLRQLELLAEPLLPAETIVVIPEGLGYVEDAVAPLRERVQVVQAEAGAPPRNAGAALARADVVAFVGADAEPAPGWLGALVDTLARRPDATLVGARVLDPTGRLAEAGLAVFSSAGVHRYGCGHDPRAPEFSFMREVHAVSGAALAVRREAFDRVGGFAPGFGSTLYEDVDLSLRLRAVGGGAVFQPGALVVEHGGAGNDGLAVPATEADRARLREAHPGLADHEPERADRLLVAAQTSRGPRLLVIAPEVPGGRQDRASARVAQELETARTAGRAVSLLPLDPTDRARMTPVLADAGVRVLPFGTGPASQAEARLRDRLEDLAPYRFQEVLVMAPGVAELVREATTAWSPAPEVKQVGT
jgi:tetratricopeptide (TPR) repeat protein